MLTLVQDGGDEAAGSELQAGERELVEVMERIERALCAIAAVLLAILAALVVIAAGG